MNKYLNTLNAGMFLCDEFKMSDDGIQEIKGIKNQLKLEPDNHVDFSFVCKLDFIEFEIPKDGGELSFRFFIRTLGGDPKFIIPFFVARADLKKNNEGVMTHSLPIFMKAKNFQFPRKGKFAIEVYKYLGRIDTDLETENKNLYRKPENFINAITFDVV
jgi:hypothetical protein